MNAPTEALLAGLLEQLVGGDAERRWQAAEAIALLGSWAIHRAAPALLARLEDESSRVRVTAATSLLKASPIPLEFLPYVLNGLRSGRTATRAWCCVMLGESETDHPAVREALAALGAGDPEDDVRWVALKALAVLGEDRPLRAD